ncbi:MAG: diguanylate cyclase [Gammaproteobacteria bacterium]|nr:diguanylate cyclase [Gammaproteobacteria bacterium]
MSRPLQQKRINPYLAALVGLWAVVQLASLVVIGWLEVDRVRGQADELHADLLRYASAQTSLYEAALEGFASFLAAVPDSTYGEARRFARLLREHYPDIYMLEIARRVPGEAREELERTMRAAGYPDFIVHTFGYESDRRPHVSPPKPVYYPIIFIEPELPQALGVLGLDLGDTSSLLTDALERSFTQRGHAASRPFRLIEGQRGYVLYRPVRGAQGPAPFELTPAQDTYALLVVDSRTLVPPWVDERPGLAVRLSYTGVAEPADATLIDVRNPPVRSGLLERRLPVFSRTTAIASRSQPFAVTTEYPLRLADLNIALLGAFVASAAVTFLLAYRYAGTLHGRRLRDVAAQEQLFERANYDALTRLPNRGLMRDRIAQALSQARRRRSRLAVLYIDLDGFKQVNDRYGHAAGDAVLQEVAQRLSRGLRAGDTLARLHGDEFVALLPDVDSADAARQVAHKLAAFFPPPCRVRGEEIEVSLSVGVAVGPDDGDTTDSLLEVADRRMYDAKRARRLRVVATD